MSTYTPSRSLRGKTVYMDWGSGDHAALTFVCWQRMRRGSGFTPDEANRIEVGAVVRCDWLAGPPFNRKPPKGFPKGCFTICHYHSLYRTARASRMRVRAIRRPPLARVRA